jgi:hypothetical protein
MDLDRKTSLRVTFFDYDDDTIHSWECKASARLALWIHSLVHLKERTDLNDEKAVSEAIDIINYDIKKFFKTPYTDGDNA